MMHLKRTTFVAFIVLAMLVGAGLGVYGQCYRKTDDAKCKSEMQTSNQVSPEIAKSCNARAAEFCKRYQTQEGFLKAKADENAAQLCGVTTASVKAAQCPKAAQGGSLAFLGAYCPVEAKPVAQKSTADIKVASVKRDMPGVGAPESLDFPTIERTTLSNGLKVTYAQRTAAPLTHVVLSFDAGMAADKPGARGLQNMAMAMLDEGTATRSAQQIAEDKERLGAVLSSAGGTDRSSVTLSALTANLAPSLELMTDVVEHRPDRHTSDNAAALVAAAFPGSPGPSPRLSPGAEPAAQPAADFRLDVPDDARLAARALIGPHPRYIVVHASGGRAIKQWDLDRFAAATAAIARAVGAAVVLSGAPGDAPLTAQVRAALPADIAVVDLTGRPDLLVLAAVLEGARLVLTGDTGPMHLAAAVRAPVVAIFGPSMPVRYAPRSTAHRVVRVDLWCAPCNMIRKPPARCQGHTPDCLTGVTVEAVIAAALSLVAETEAARA